MIQEADEFGLDIYLYEDTKDKHFISLLRSWKYSEACLNYAYGLRKAIEEDVGLPPLLETSDKRWINSCALAIFILCKQLNIGFPKLSKNKTSAGLHDSGLPALWEIYDASRNRLAQGLQEEIEHCFNFLEQLLKERETPDALLQDAHLLLEEASRLEAEFKKAMLLQSLPGDCRYCKI